VTLHELDVPWQKLLEKPYARMHFVQLYDSDPYSLGTNVDQYVSAGLSRGDGVLLVATAEHRTAFGGDSVSGMSRNQLIYLDADQTLAQVTCNGRLAWRRFSKVIGGALARVRPRKPSNSIRVYGEMLALLWKSHGYDAALRLETFWNRLVSQSSFSLYCAYSMDPFDPGPTTVSPDAILCMHSHVIPSDPTGRLKKALLRALREELGKKSHVILNLSLARRPASWIILSEAEALLLWVKNHLPERAARILAVAREHYHRPAAFAA
jgi:hypothetical protein